MKLSPIPLDKQFKAPPYRYQVVDLEARNWIDFIVGGYFDGGNYLEFTNLDEFCELVNDSKKSLNIFAHFGGGYDFLFLINAFLENKIEIIQIVPRGSMILSMKIQGKYRQHTFRDSSAILPFSLKKLTENFDVETKKGEYDHSKNRGYNQELCDYLKSDCLGLYQVLRKYFDSPLIRKAGASTTIASQAQKILRTYLKEDMFSLSDQVNEFCRLACLGGRTEIFKPLGKNLKEYDANSLYPFAMLNEFPIGNPTGTYHYKTNKLGIYKVRVKAPNNLHIPIVGLKKDNKLLFPLGEFETYITSVEMEFAKEYGYKFEVLDGYYWDKKGHIFKEFINDIYKIRKESKAGSVDNILAKLIMNSAYGKFNIKTERENLVFDKNLRDEDNATPIKEIQTKLGIIELFTIPVTLNTFKYSAYSAFILAYGRIHMQKIMQPICNNVYYTDTDSIFTDLELPTGSELGELKLEKTYDEACFLLPKTYIAENKDYKKIVMKGFDKRKIQHLTSDDFKACLIGDRTIAIEHDKTIAKFKTAINKNKLLYLKKSFTKQINSKYNKRVVNLKLNKTSPLIITA